MRRWFAYEGMWKSKKGDIWVEEQPPIPEWASPLDRVRFVQVWVASKDLNTVRKHIFWMSQEELELTVSEISACLELEGYNPLPKRDMRTKGLFSEDELILLEEQGCITLKVCEQTSNNKDANEHSSEDDHEYDVVQALLSSPQPSYEPLSHIQTTEAGRFTAKH